MALPQHIMLLRYCLASAMFKVVVRRRVPKRMLLSAYYWRKNLSWHIANLSQGRVIQKKNQVLAEHQYFFVVETLLQSAGVCFTTLPLNAFCTRIFRAFFENIAATQCAESFLFRLH
jgi:hypothetical protein